MVLPMAIRRLYPVWLALLAPLGAAALMIPLRTHVPNTDLALAMVVIVAVIVLPGWRTGALLAGLSAGVWFDFFLTKPYESFSIESSSDVQTTVLLAVTGFLIGEIAYARKVAHRESATARNEVVSLYVVSEMLAAGSKADSVVRLIADQLRDLMVLDDCHFEASATDTGQPMLDRSGELQYGRLHWPLDVEGLPNRDVMLPVECQGQRLGYYVLRGPAIGVPLSQDRRLASVALSDLAGAALVAAVPG
jgi:hypothetical protein